MYEFLQNLLRLFLYIVSTISIPLIDSLNIMSSYVNQRYLLICSLGIFFMPQTATNSNLLFKDRWQIVLRSAASKPAGQSRAIPNQQKSHTSIKQHHNCNDMIVEPLQQ